jgi:hypothetical protein
MNRAQVRTKVLKLLNRNDCTDDIANDFIDLAQSRIERVLRIPGMEKIGTVTGNAPDVPTESIVIPTDFLSLKSLYTLKGPLVYKDLNTFLPIPQGGCSPVYTRVGSSYLLKPTLAEGELVYMWYYATQPALLADTDSNIFSLICSDILIYGALCFAADYFVDDRIDFFEKRYASLKDEIEEQGRMTDMEQGTMAIEPAYDTEY